MWANPGMAEEGNDAYRATSILGDDVYNAPLEAVTIIGEESDGTG
jgi:hypothetical protein